MLLAVASSPSFYRHFVPPMAGLFPSLPFGRMLGNAQERDEESR